MAETHRPSPEQQAVIDTWGQGLAIVAGAGAGKTTTLVTKCAELLARNPKARFAAVSFTEKSASDLREKLSKRLEGGVRGHWVTTIHGLCGAIIRDFPREAGLDGEESVLSEPEAQLLWSRAFEGLWFEELATEVQTALESLLARESRSGVESLIRRARELEQFGVLESLRSLEDPFAHDLATISEYVLERYGRAKRRRGVLDFNDLERGAERALRSDHVREVFHRRFDLVMVDEFQDTNPVQARIIWSFARPDLSNLCVVGDPKQSIYRFRDADVSVFQECCERLPSKHSLTWNFRSRPGIIEYANVICQQLFEASPEEYRTPFEPLVAKREAAKECEPVLRLDVKSPADLAVFIRAEVARGVPLNDMALLLRKIRGNEAWLKALSQAGIPLAIGSGGLFWEDPRVRELGALLKWWDNPANALSGAVFLRAPWVGIADELLDRWVREDPTWWKPFFECDHPLARALAPLRERIIRPGELLLALLDLPGVEAELGAQLLGLWHRVEELSARGLDFHSVALEISESVKNGRRERDVPPPKNQGQLSVLTLHSSKGLEFPHVILVDLGRKPQNRDIPLLFWDRAQGAFLGPRTEDGERDKKNALEAQWRQMEIQKRVAESKRLFYVALTRAQERLILVCPETDKEFDPEKDLAEDHWRGWVEATRGRLPARPAAELSAEASDPGFKASREDRLSAGNRAPRRSARDSRQFTRPRHSVTEWNVLSRCARAYEWAYVRPRPVVEGVVEIGLFTGKKVASFEDEELTQKELGIRVHHCLETGDYDGLRRLETEAGSERFVADPIISWAMSSPLMAPPAPALGRDVWTEFNFEASVRGEVLVGTLDRLVLDRGDYYIVDFKVTEKPKSVDSMLEAYQRQLELYAWALGRLEPSAVGRTQALLVNISAKTIQTVPVPLTGGPVPGARVEGFLEQGGQVGQKSPFEEMAESLARESAAILSGAEGGPTPGPLCRVCQFRGMCPESRMRS